MRLEVLILGHFAGTGVLAYARVFTSRELSGFGLRQRGFAVGAGRERENREGSCVERVSRCEKIALAGTQRADGQRAKEQEDRVFSISA